MDYVRKTPVKAFQWDGGRPTKKWPDWILKQIKDGVAGVGFTANNNLRLWLARDNNGRTLTAEPGDWIVNEPFNEFLMAFTPKAFESTYAPAKPVSEAFYLTWSQCERGLVYCETHFFADLEAQRSALADLAVDWNVSNDSGIAFKDMAHGSLTSQMRGFCDNENFRHFQFGTVPDLSNQERE